MLSTVPHLLLTYALSLLNAGRTRAYGGGLAQSARSTAFRPKGQQKCRQRGRGAGTNSPAQDADTAGAFNFSFVLAFIFLLAVLQGGRGGQIENLAVSACWSQSKMCRVLHTHSHTVIQESVVSSAFTLCSQKPMRSQADFVPFTDTEPYVAYCRHGPVNARVQIDVSIE